MRAPKYTPGPWEAWDNPDGLPIIYRKDKGYIAFLRMEPSVSGPEVDANAALISAAPDMAEALQRARSFIASLNGRCDYNAWQESYHVVSVLDAALKKAGVEL